MEDIGVDQASRSAVVSISRLAAEISEETLTIPTMDHINPSEIASRCGTDLEQFMQDVKALRVTQQFPDILIINMDETTNLYDIPKPSPASGCVHESVYQKQWEDRGKSSYLLCGNTESDEDISSSDSDSDSDDEDEAEVVEG